MVQATIGYGEFAEKMESFRTGEGKDSLRDKVGVKFNAIGKTPTGTLVTHKSWAVVQRIETQLLSKYQALVAESAPHQDSVGSTEEFDGEGIESITAQYESPE